MLGEQRCGAQSPLGAQQGVSLAEQPGRIGERAAAEADRPFAVAPGEVLAHGAQASHAVTGCVVQLVYGSVMLGRDYDGQNCSIARTLEVVGERWTLLIMREAFLGTKRFDEFQRRLGIARNILQARLERLVEEDVLVRRPYQERPPRYEYRLTAAGVDLLPVLVALLEWGDRHRAPAGPPVVPSHRGCGGRINAALVCDSCGAQVDPAAFEVLFGPGAGPERSGTRVELVT